MSQMSESSYPKNGSTISGEDQRLDACGEALDDIHRRLDAVMTRHGRRDAVEAEDNPEYDREIAEAAGARENAADRRDSGDLGPDNTLTTPGQGRGDVSEAERAHGKLNEKEEAAANPHVAAREAKPKGVYLRPEDETYPVKVRRGGDWEYDRGLLLAAEREATMHGDEHLAQEAKRIREREFGGDEGKKDASARTDPPVSEAQRRFMRWASEHPSEAGVKKSVSEEFNEADPGGKLPSRKDSQYVPAPPYSSEVDEARDKVRTASKDRDPRTGMTREWLAGHGVRAPL